MRSRVVFTPAIALCSLLLSVGAPAAHAGTDLHKGVLKTHEVPSYFTSANVKVYTATTPFMKVKVQTKFGSKDDVCATPSILVATYKQALFQSFGSTAATLPSFRVCSFLYSSSSLAHRVYVDRLRTAVANTRFYSAKKVASRVGNESTAYTGHGSQEMVFRTGNVVVDVWYLDLKGVQLSNSAFLHLGTLLVSRLR